MSKNPIDKEKEKGELTGFLATTHGEITGAAKKIAESLDALIKNKNKQNEAIFIAAIKEAMAIPKNPDFKHADEQVKKALLEILGEAKEFIHTGLQDFVAFNEKIKQEKNKLKKRVEELQKRQLGRSGP